MMIFYFVFFISFVFLVGGMFVVIFYLVKFSRAFGCLTAICF